MMNLFTNNLILKMKKIVFKKLNTKNRMVQKYNSKENNKSLENQKKKISNKVNNQATGKSQNYKMKIRYKKQNYLSSF